MKRASVAVLRRHPWLTAEVLLVGAALITFGLVYFAPQDLFLHTTVHDALPTATVDVARSGVGGSQNLAPTAYRSVTVWCRRFDVVFGAAALRIP